MNKTVVFYSNKGGVGKSFLTRATAIALSHQPQVGKIQIIDTNHPQYTSYGNREEEAEYFESLMEKIKSTPLAAEESRQLESYLDLVGSGKTVAIEKAPDMEAFNALIKESDADITFIDIKGELDEKAIGLVARADFIFVPTDTDRDNFKEAYNIYAALSKTFEEKSVYLIFNKIRNDVGTRRELKNLRKALQDSDIKVFEHAVYNYKEYRDASTFFPINDHIRGNKSFDNYLREFISITHKN